MHDHLTFGAHTNDTTMLRDIAIGDWVKRREPTVALTKQVEGNLIEITYQIANPGETSDFELAVSFTDPTGYTETTRQELEILSGQQLVGTLTIPRASLPTGNSRLTVSVNIARAPLGLGPSQPLPLLQLAADTLELNKPAGPLDHGSGPLQAETSIADLVQQTAPTVQPMQSFMGQPVSPLAALTAQSHSQAASLPPVLLELSSKLPGR